MTYIKEVILENFMSYRYARIPFQKGLNIITGPNGSGKSSILLGISVALGQTYTERGRRLGDLVRKGEDIARVTVVFDNSQIDGKRSFPWFRTDEVYFTRYIRVDGDYWHEVNGKVTPKVEVIRYLKRVGINPNNMLIIMHQNMIEQFIYLSPQDKLRIVEEIIGLRAFRERILSSFEELKKIQDEEKSLSFSLKDAKEKFDYWNTMYERYLKRQELERKLKELLAERYWRLVYEKRIDLEKIEGRIRDFSNKIDNIKHIIQKGEKYKDSLLKEINDLENKILLGHGDIKYLINSLREKWLSYTDIHGKSIENKVILNFLLKDLKELKREEERIMAKIKELESKASLYGEETIPNKEVGMIDEEIRKIELSIASLGSIPENIIDIYNKYKEIFEEYKIRVNKLSENKGKLLVEIDKRINLWKEKIVSMIDMLQKNFSSYLDEIDAVGRIELVNIDDIANCGLVIYVGFRGSPLTVLDAYTHSGGEKTSTVMVFLLALQDYIKSPIRAVDEFDVHMDPRNRRTLLSLLFNISRKNPDIQYIIITPGIIEDIPEDSNVLIVQKTLNVSSWFKYR